MPTPKAMLPQIFHEARIQFLIMKTKTDILLELWLESRTRFTNQLDNLSETDLQKSNADDHSVEIPILVAERSRSLAFVFCHDF